MLAEETNISKTASRAGHHPGGEGGESRPAGGGVEKGGEAMHTIMILVFRVVSIGIDVYAFSGVRSCVEVCAGHCVGKEGEEGGRVGGVGLGSGQGRHTIMVHKFRAVSIGTALHTSICSWSHLA